MARPGGLGKGLRALIADVDSQAGEFSEISPDAIFPNPSQPRRRFDAEKLDELAASIRANGVVQPIVVRRIADKFEIVAGERRWRAAKIAGLEVIPVVIRSLSDSDAVKIALLENLQREDLNPIEEAEAYRTLIDEYKLTQEALAESLAKSRPSITNALRLLALPLSVRGLVQDGTLSMGHARALLGVTTPEVQLELAQRVMAEGLSVRQVERLVQVEASMSVSRETVGRKKREPSKEFQQVEEALQASLRTKVRLKTAKDGISGKIEIEYYSRDELDRLIEMLAPNSL